MSVTADDLLKFHKSHLGEFQGTIKFDQDENAYNEEPTTLGFYPDGVERTLTDEQIEFFRQSDLRKEELRIYKENLALQEAQADAKAQDPTSQQTLKNETDEVTEEISSSEALQESSQTDQNQS